MGRFLRDESGATAIEYGLICAAMAVIIVTLMGTGGALGAVYDTCNRIIAAVRSANGTETSDSTT